MPSRFIPSRRSSTGSASTSKLQDQFIRDLTREAQKVLKDLSADFSRDLEKQGASFLEGLLGQGGSAGGAGGGGASGLSGFTGLFSSATRLLVGRPKTRTTTAESSRSNEIESRFKLGQAQSLAEAGVMLNKGEKNL